MKKITWPVSFAEGDLVQLPLQDKS